MANVLIFDTSIFIDQLRTSRHQHRISSVTGVVRTSAVVLAELWRGATRKAERDFLAALERNHPVLVPTEKQWSESGQLLSRIHADHGFNPDKLRNMHFDVLLALTARAHGARLITSNQTDFELIRRYRHFQMEVW